jgi:hypothetical protein
MGKKQIVYILSTNYAGSHFLSLMLGSHSRCTSLGEIHRFRRKVKRREVCLLCGRDEICPVMKGISYEKLPWIYDIVFSNLAQMDPNIRTVIDNSKKVEWAERFLGLQDYDLKFIHLIRDPRALVRRWLNNNDTPEKRWKKRSQLARHNLLLAPRILRGKDEEVFAYKWVLDNRKITRFLERHRLNHRIVTYRDLAVERERTIGELVDWMGYAFEPEQVHYWKFVHHGSRKKDYDSTGRNGERLFDLRWRQDLSPEAQRRITENIKVKDYITSLDLVLQPDGLTHLRETRS